MTIAEFNPRLRQRIAMAIDDAEMHQKDVAARMGVSPQVISAWVRGSREPSPSKLVELAAVTKSPWLLDLRGLARISDQDESSSGWMWETAGQAA